MPTLQSLIRGKPFNVDCYIEKIDTSRLPGPDATEAEHSTFLYTVFEKMDKLMEQHLREDSFPKSAIMKVKRPSIFKTLRFVLLNFVFSASLVYLLVYQAIVTHSFYLRLVIYSVIITGKFFNLVYVYIYILKTYFNRVSPFQSPAGCFSSTSGCSTQSTVEREIRKPVINWFKKLKKVVLMRQV